jgi:pilus assembly protein Flp/PilA
MTTKILRHAKELVAQEEGATMVEYGLMVALIAVAAMAAISTFGTMVANTLFRLPL